MGGRCSCTSDNCTSDCGGKSHSQDRHDKRYTTEVVRMDESEAVRVDDNTRGLRTFPFQWQEGQLSRADGHPLKTDLVSLADVDGDGVEIGEVVRAIFMVPPGHESTIEHEGGELLYPEFTHDDAEQSAFEIMLRNEVKQLDERLAKVITKVKRHRDELEDDHARDTHDFLLQKTAHIAKEAADLGVVLCSENVEAHRALQQKIVGLAEAANALTQHLAQHLGPDTETETTNETGAQTQEQNASSSKALTDPNLQQRIAELEKKIAMLECEKVCERNGNTISIM
eukprot:gnl/MRDRNA2_/MRDRNA2_77144_c0_seq1.p1 gnl/MRDRNA2_/MRDRNA2_77144_c0~~gnl/MRDRNA2_/MRDRNA2_77144_c0_seq1.p1  ORF type:complete len:284 (-),score=56.48 gnl/MRDRNA2_/MRDRNA2_77144_c0_seq1:850-1701(-)